MSPINRLAAAAAIVLVVGGLSVFVLSNRGGGPARRAITIRFGDAFGRDVAFPVPVPEAVAGGDAHGDASQHRWLAPVHVEPLRVHDRLPPDVGRHAGHASLGPRHRSPGGPGAGRQPGRLPRHSPPNGSRPQCSASRPKSRPGRPRTHGSPSYYAGRNYCPTMPTFVSITVDGHAGRLDACYDAQAFVFVGNRVYVFVIYQNESNRSSRPSCRRSGSRRPTDRFAGSEREPELTR